MPKPARARARVILGIDPGLASAGLAVVAQDRGNFCAISYACVTTKPGEPFPERLAALNRATREMIIRFGPTELAMERLFFAKNAKTAIMVGQAQGAMLLAAAGLSLPVFQYTPLEVKMAVTGSGSAGKAPVARMIMRLFRLSEIPTPDDAADALAVGYCHLISTRTGSRHD